MSTKHLKVIIKGNKVFIEGEEGTIDENGKVTMKITDKKKGKWIEEQLKKGAVEVYREE